MSEYYRAKRTRNLYDPLSSEPFRISRSKLDLFLNCPKCFYLDRRLGVGQPPGFPFNLNSAVDALLKKEFDLYRELQEPHPMFAEHGVSYIPFKHDKLEEWRDSLRQGISTPLPKTNLILTGGVDDVWIDPKTKDLVIADYKATSKNGEVSLDADWQIGYKRQIEVYQWLFRQNGFKVSDIAYFVYCNGRTDRPRFDKRLEFSISLIAYKGNAGWVSESCRKLYECLQSKTIPKPSENCDFCAYSKATQEVIAAHQEQSQERLF